MTTPSTTPYVLLLLAMLLEGSPGCPRVCMCKWKNGKQTVECGNRGLLAIPEQIESDTQVLEFCDNNLQFLTKEKFLKMNIINLQRIYLCRCKISSIDDHTFKGLTNLVELDLSGNLLISVPNGAFIDCPSLMKLTLNNNPIGRLQKSTFGYLSYLTTLELRNCMLSIIEEGAFQGLNSLEWLHLEGNNLTTMIGRRIFPQSLREVDLHGNPWKCDCNIRDLHAWLLESNVPRQIEPTCQTPETLAKNPIRSIPTPQLACLPTITPATFLIEIAEGRNLTILCHVHAIPAAHVSWWFHGQVLRNDSEIAPGLHLIYFFEDGGAEEKDSKLVIQHANADDNGTYVCSAENAAGVMRSNFTVNILVKEMPAMVVVAFDFDYRFIIIIAVCSLLTLFLIISVALIVRCRRVRQQRRRKKAKAVALECQRNAKKTDEIIGVAEKVETVCEEEQSEPVHCGKVLVPISVCPSAYQLEQNPDLINDTEGGARRLDGDGEPARAVNPRELCCADVRLSPSCFLDTDGFPVDYGLPKVRPQPSPNCYRTLPYGRSFRRHTAANPLTRFSREAEFLTHSVQPASYEHYCSGVRYTAAGYPPEPGTVDAPATSPCCTTPATVHWAACVPTQLEAVAKRCVGAQTDQVDDEEVASKSEDISSGAVHEVLTESPDEGYEGEPALV